MNLRISIGLLIFAAIVLPVVVGTAVLLSTSGSVPEDERDADLSRVTARLLRRELNTTIRIFELGTELFDLTSLPPRETTGVLRMLYKQDADLTVVALLDGDDQAVVEPVFLRAEQLGPDSRKLARLPVDEKDLARFLEHLPIEAAREGGRAFSDVYVDRRRNSALIAGAMMVPAGEGRNPYLLAFERSLRGVQQAVIAGIRGGSPSSVFVVDGGGRLVAHPDGNRVLQRESMAGHPLVARFLAGERFARASYSIGGTSGNSGASPGPEVEMSGAFQKLDTPIPVNWAVVVQRPRIVAGPASLPAWALVAWLVVALAVASIGWFLIRAVRTRLLEARQLQSTYERRAEELKRVQAALLETRKLNAIGDLGAGVAHEFNNPLGGILGLTQLLLRRKKDGDADLQFLKRIEKEAKRCKAITDNLLRFSEQQESGHREPQHLAWVMDKALDLIDSKLKSERIRVRRVYAENLPRVICNESEVQRAFLNVISNAETAMPDGGDLTLTTLADDDWVLFKIADTGRGIAQENLQRVFEPFFSTKDNWKGAGLGLWVVYQIIQDLGGGISVESEEDHGAVVTFRLPNEERTRRADSAAGNLPKSIGSG